MSVVGGTQKAAERSFNEAIAARASRTTCTEATPDSSLTRPVELWLDDLDLEGKVADSTRALYERNMRQLVMPAFESHTLREITTGRVDTDLADRLDVALSTLHREVVRLDEAGLIVSRTLGRNRMLRANVDHPAAKALTELLEVTFGPRAVIAEEFAMPAATEVVIFGSWAARYSGEAGPPPHDIDVLVVGDVDRADVYDAADRATTRLGIEVNPVVRSDKQWSDPEDPLVKQIKASAHTTVLDRRERVNS